MRTRTDASAAALETERLVRLFMDVAASPNGGFVASVQGDAPCQESVPSVINLSAHERPDNWSDPTISRCEMG